MARRYGLPWRSSNATASNVVDAQAAYEAEMAVWGAVMGGVNLLYQGAGWLEGGLTASYEKLIIDAEILQMMSEVLQPVPVDEAEPRLRRHRRRRARRPFLRDGPYARALRDRVLPAARVRLAQLRDVAGGRRADRDRAGQQIWKRLLAEAVPPPLDPPVAEALDAFVARRKREIERGR